MALKRWVVFLLFISTLGILWGKIFPKFAHFESFFETGSHSSSSSTRASSDRLFMHLLLSEKKKAQEWISMSQLSLECKEFAEELESLDLKGFRQKRGANFLFNKDLPKLRKSCTIEEPDYSIAEKNYLKKCLLTNALSLGGVDQGCAEALLILRSSMTQLLSQGRPPSEVDGNNEAADLLYVSWAIPNLNGSAPRWGALNHFGKAVSKLDSDLKLPYKAQFVARLGEWKLFKQTHSPVEQAQFWKEMKEFAEELKSNESQAQAFKNMSIAVETRGFESTFIRTYVDGLKGGAEEEARGLFLLSLSQWKDAEAEASLKSLMGAIHLDPKNPIYTEAFRSLSVPQSGEEVFLSFLGVMLTAEDFENL